MPTLQQNKIIKRGAYAGIIALALVCLAVILDFILLHHQLNSIKYSLTIVHILIVSAGIFQSLALIQIAKRHNNSFLAVAVYALILSAIVSGILNIIGVWSVPFTESIIRLFISAIVSVVIFVAAMGIAQLHPYYGKIT